MDPNDRLKRKLTAIFYADVVGYSRLTGEDEEGNVKEFTSTWPSLAFRKLAIQSSVQHRHC